MKSLFDIGHRHNASALREKKRGLVGFPMSLNSMPQFYSRCIRRRVDDTPNSGDGIRRIAAEDEPCRSDGEDFRRRGARATFFEEPWGMVRRQPMWMRRRISGKAHRLRHAGTGRVDAENTEPLDKI
jgi:hypothetical protein